MGVTQGTGLCKRVCEAVYCLNVSYFYDLHDKRSTVAIINC
jgi:hypothetical protein